MLHVPLVAYQYIKILLVCPSVCDGCGRGHNEFAGRVQNYRVPCAKLSRAFQLSQKFSRDSKSCCWSGHSELQATRRMPLWKLPSH